MITIDLLGVGGPKSTQYMGPQNLLLALGEFFP